MARTEVEALREFERKQAVNAIGAGDLFFGRSNLVFRRDLSTDQAERIAETELELETQPWN